MVLAQTFDSLQANKANQTNKALTIISTVMLPMTVVSSIYGMNVNCRFSMMVMRFGIFV